METSVEKILVEIHSCDSLEFRLSFLFCKKCSALLRDTLTAEDGRRIIITILDNWEKVDPSTHEIWTDIIESEGFYPYLVKGDKFTLNQTSGLIRQGMSQSKNLDYFLHDEQLQVKNILDSNKNVILSAPTSFGKSLLIEELVAEGKYNNIVVIQPTLALLDETRKKLKKYQERYQIIVRTSQPSSEEKNNLFLLTAERVMEYQDLPKIDLLIIDEFYKLSAERDDERSDVLNNAFHLLLQRDNVKFYLLGPNIDGISDGFIETYNAVFYKTKYSLVEQIVQSKYSPDFGNGSKKIEKIKKESALFELLFELKDEQTLIYCSSPSRARSLSNKYLNYLLDRIEPADNELSISEWIKSNVSETWSLLNCLSYKIAFHDGSLQKHITTSVINYFNENKINFLFCTSTIIEGVNTSAKNIVIFDNTKGLKQPIDYFDYSNIKGRAGRMMIHYTGKVFNFNPEFIKSEELIVDIPFFQQDPIKDEVLLHLEDKEVKHTDTDQFKALQQLPENERLLFKKNGVLVYGQKDILEQLREKITENNELFIWNGFPKYNQLKAVLDLAWENLLKKGESFAPMTSAYLTRVTFNYAKNQSIYWLVEDIYSSSINDRDLAIEKSSYYSELTSIEKKAFKTTAEGKQYSRGNPKKNHTDADLRDEAIRIAFNILRHWFQYKVPKWLRTIHSLQEFVCNEKGIEAGNYLFYAEKIESDFIRKNLSILLEYGIPRSAISKLEPLIKRNISEQDVIAMVKSENIMEKSGLITYEKEKIITSL